MRMPQTEPTPEGIIGMPVFGRREIRDILGIEAARIVVAARKETGARAVRDGFAELKNQIEIFDVSAVIRHIAV